MLDGGANGVGGVEVAAESGGFRIADLATAIWSELKMLLRRTRPAVGVASR